MADDITLNAGSGGATLRTLEDAGGKHWQPAVVTYATTVGTPDVLQVVTASAGLPVAQQGVWTVTANAGSGTFAVSAASLPLPTGAATAAKQPALGTAGSAAVDVLTVQGIASMTSLKVDGSGVTQPVSGTFWQATQPVSVAAAVTVQDGGGSLTVDNGGTFAVQASQTGTWTVRSQDGTGNALTSRTTGASRPLEVAILDGSGNQITAFGGSGGTASNFGSAFPASGTAIGAKDSAGTNMAALNLDASGYLKVNVAAGGGSGGTSSSFGSAIPATGTAAGYSDGTNMQLARVFDYDTGAGSQYVAGVGIRLSSSGGSVEGGTASNPLRTDPTGTTTQPVSGTITANAGSGTFTVSGTVTANVGTGTQPVSGTVTANAGTGTFAVSAASLPLPTGAATDAKLPSLGTAGTPSSNVITVQGITSMTALKVDGSAVTQPVSGTFWQGTQPVSIASSVPVTDNAGSLTVDAPVGTPVFVRLSDGSAAITTLPVSLASLPTLAAGTNNIGDVDVLTLPATPAGTNLIGRISASNETDSIYSGSTALTPKFAAITASSSGNTSVVAAVAGKKIRVLRWSVSSNGAVNVKFQRATTDVTGLYYLTQFASVGGGYCPVGHFETASNEALNINLSGAMAVGGVLTYCEV
jgi:hypothetical protein